MKVGKVLVIIGFIMFLAPFLIFPLMMAVPSWTPGDNFMCIMGLSFLGFGLIFVGSIMSGGSVYGSGWGAPGPRQLPYQPYQYGGGQPGYQPPPQPGPPSGPQYHEGGYETPPGYPAPPQRPVRPEMPARAVDRPGYDGSGTAPGDVKQLTISGLGLQCPQCGGPSKEVGHWGWKKCGQCGHKFK